MSLFSAPASFASRTFFNEAVTFRDASSSRAMAVMSSENHPPMSSWGLQTPLGHLTLLVFEAVLEVVCVSLPGYIVARQGMFDADSQKFVANLNVVLFTPCLIFTKLASQLTADKLAELAVIPVIFVVQTLVSYGCSFLLSHIFRLKKRPRNFVVAMSVFGNSNSLPISLVISLAKTIKGLHWDRIPGDNDEEVAARGILYLLIFQQLGQLLRWSWGFHVLLAPAKPDTPESEIENHDRYQDSPDESLEVSPRSSVDGDADDLAERALLVNGHPNGEATSSNVTSGAQTPTGPQVSNGMASKKWANGSMGATPTNGNIAPPLLGSSYEIPPPEDHEGTGVRRVRSAIARGGRRMSKSMSCASTRAFHRLPKGLQQVLSQVAKGIGRFVRGVWAFMNPPLWAMLAAIVVASIPALQRLFFTPGTFISNSVTSAVRQSGGVAVPLILVVLGANLARNTVSSASLVDEDPSLNRKLLIASLLGRMLLPTIIMAPMLALAAKYIPVSILDDPIFVVVCFLLTGAPSALQLAQICQINGVYESVMSKLLFQSYVIWYVL
ncbi:MAG: hypothetical protein M1823_003892 [Watsoniomyces obsoletus]|nr:MAG: hypothetical protein M1823_003892 [Watsoniomyces obsoletus]